MSKIVKNFWDTNEQATIHNQPALLETVAAGPALGALKADLARKVARSKTDATNPLPKYAQPFISVKALSLGQPPKANWFVTTSLSYTQIDHDGQPLGTAEDTFSHWVFMFVPDSAGSVTSAIGSPVLTPSAKTNGGGPVSSPSNAGGGNVGKTPAVSPSAGAPSGQWMAYMHYTLAGVTEDFALSTAETNGKLETAKAGDYRNEAGSLAVDYATYLTQLWALSVPNEVPYATGPQSFSAQQLPSSNFFSTVAGTNFSVYSDQPLFSYVNDNKDEVVLFALQFTTSYKPTHPGCLTNIGKDNLTDLQPSGSYHNMTITGEVLVVASIPPNSRPTQGGRLLVGLEGEQSQLSATGVHC